MTNRYKTVGLLSTLSILILSSSALADQSIHQRVSGSTRAGGENATAVSHTEQGAYQSINQPEDSDTAQVLWQGVIVDTVSEDHSTATTHVIQSATQTVVSGWEDEQAQQLLQSAGVSNAAFDNSTSQSVTDQDSTQVYEGF